MTVVSVLLDFLADAVDETTEEMAQTIRREFPDYRRFASPEAERAWRDGLRATLGLFVAVAKGRRGLDAEERRQVAVIGETRAAQGVHLDVVLGSVRLAMHVALCIVRRHAEGLRYAYDIEDAVDRVSLLMTRFVNDISTDISRGLDRPVGGAGHEP